jgi:hypothetical protein
MRLLVLWLHGRRSLVRKHTSYVVVLIFRNVASSYIRAIEGNATTCAEHEITNNKFRAIPKHAVAAPLDNQCQDQR